MSQPLIVTSKGLSLQMPRIVSNPLSEPIKPIIPPSTKERPQERWIRPVSFSLLDPIEAQLCDHASKHSSFSAYVKRLILKDMK
jgi:hypothetical protein